MKSTVEMLVRIVVVSSVQELDQSFDNSRLVTIQSDVVGARFLKSILLVNRARSVRIMLTLKLPSAAALMTSDWPTTTALCTLKISPLQERDMSLYWPEFII